MLIPAGKCAFLTRNCGENGAIPPHASTPLFRGFKGKSGRNSREIGGFPRCTCLQSRLRPNIALTQPAQAASRQLAGELFEARLPIGQCRGRQWQRDDVDWGSVLLVGYVEGAVPLPFLFGLVFGL